MTPKRRARSAGKVHRFGGDWTAAKLDVLSTYLKSRPPCFAAGNANGAPIAIRIANHLLADGAG